MSKIDLAAAMEPAEVSVGEVVYPPGGRLGPRWERNVLLMCVYTGSARVQIDDRPVFTVPAEWAALLLPGHREHFAFADTSDTHHAWIEFPLRSSPKALLDRLAAVPQKLPTSSAVSDLFTEAIVIDRTPLSTARPLVTSLATAAVLRYVGEAESRGTRDEDPVERARSFLHAHTSDHRIDLQQVAQAAHVSPSHLVRRFHAELGVTPMAYLWRRRVANGVDLLMSTGLPVGEIAARSGFTSVYHFSRRVKAHTGLPPTELRRERWSASDDSAPRGLSTEGDG